MRNWQKWGSRRSSRRSNEGGLNAEVANSLHVEHQYGAVLVPELVTQFVQVFLSLHSSSRQRCSQDGLIYKVTVIEVIPNGEPARLLLSFHT